MSNPEPIYRCPSCISSALATRQETPEEMAEFLADEPATLFFCKECGWAGGLYSLQVFCSDQDQSTTSIGH